MEKKYIDTSLTLQVQGKRVIKIKNIYKKKRQHHKILITGKKDTFLSNPSLYYCDLYTTVIALHFKQVSETGIMLLVTLLA